MLILNFIRAMLLLAAFGLYHIYNHEFLSWDQGLVFFTISFLGLMLWEIVESYVITAFNGEARTGPSVAPAQLRAGRAPRID